MRRMGEWGPERSLVTANTDSPKFSTAAAGEWNDAEVLCTVRYRRPGKGSQQRCDFVNQWGSEIGAEKDWPPSWTRFELWGCYPLSRTWSPEGRSTWKLLI